MTASKPVKVAWLRPIVFVLNRSGDLKRLLRKNPTIACHDIAAWNYAELRRSLRCKE